MRSTAMVDSARTGGSKLAQVAELRYGPDFVATERLRDGTVVRLRPLRPEDRARFQEGFEKLSPESRYRRFFAATPRLPERVIRYLVETDGWNHFALGAEVLPEDPSATPEGIGVARWIRLREEPTVAEAAVTVVDAWQGRGVGGLLLRHLVAAARERNVTCFRAWVLADNEAARSLVESLAGSVAPRRERDCLVYELPLPEPEGERVRADPLYALLRKAAEGLEVVLRRLFREPDGEIGS